jgi:PAS domain-containing protein
MAPRAAPAAPRDRGSCINISRNYIKIVAKALEASDTIVAVLEASRDVQGGLRFMSANTALEAAIGRTTEQQFGLALGDIAAPEATPALDAIAIAVDLRRPWRGDLVCLNNAGKIVCIGCRLMPAQVARAPAQIYVLIGRDITARRAEAQAARTLNNLLAKAFLTADVPLAIVNANGRFVMTNQSMDAQLGCPLDSPAGKPATDFLPPQILTAGLETQQSDGVPNRSVVDLRRTDGQSLPVLLSCASFEGLDRNRFSIITTRPAESGLPASAPAAPGTKPAKPTHFQVAGLLRFIDLEDVRETFKHQWDLLGGRVLDAAERIIRKHLQAGDEVSRDMDRGFTICFARGTEEQATQRSTAMAREIRTHLINLGEDENLVAMQVAVARIPVLAGTPAGDQIARHLGVVAEAGLRAALAPLVPPRTRRAYRTSSGLLAAVHVSPMPRPTAPGCAVIPGSTMSQHLAPVSWAATRDAATQTEPLLIDLDFELFVRRDRTEALLDVCARLPTAIRPHLNFLLVNLPAGTTTSLMQGIGRRLKPFCAGVGWHLDDWSVPSFDLRACQLAWAVADLSAWTGPPLAPPQRLKRLADLLAAHGVKSLASCVVSSDAIKQLDAANIYCATLSDEENQSPVVL